MPLFTRTIAIIAGVIAVPVFGYSVIGSYYNTQSVIDTHLAELVNGTNTSVVVSTNAPNWSIGTPLATPILNTAATSTGGSMASSTTVYFGVSALDGTGTTTMSNILSVTTDSAASLLPAEGFELTWQNVIGATGYAIFFGSSPTALNNYFYATTSGAYYMASSTLNALTGSYTKTDTTAFSVLFNPYGPDYISNSTTTATSTPVNGNNALQVSGNFAATSNGTTTVCNAASAGSVFYNLQNSHEWGCNGTAWTKVF